MTGPGRPSTGVRVDIRIPASTLANVDALAAHYGKTRAETLRRIIAKAADDPNVLALLGRRQGG